jgi:predicted HicB family RNase H-like nuclease
MADKTFGVKVSEELHDRVKEMIDANGITAKEWFEKAVSMT